MAGMGRLVAIFRAEDAADAVPERLVLLRTDGRADFIVALRGRETVDFGLAVDDFGLAVVAFAFTVVRFAVPALAVVRGLAAVLGLAMVVDLTAVRGLAAVLGLAVVRGLAAVLGLAAALGMAVVRGLAAVLGLVTLGLAERAFGFVVEALGLAVLGLTAALARIAGFRLAAGRRVAVAAGLADDMVLAADVSAFAAVAIDLVAVFMDRIAADMVRAEEEALVAAAVILLAAEVTLVAAEDTFFAAIVGDAALLDEVLRERDAMLRVERDAMLRVERAAVLRVERAAVLRVDREAGLRVLDAVPAGFAATLRVVFLAVLMVLALVFGRLAVPDALRLTDLLRAVLAELRRLAARVLV
jgi:hypothetical protein